MAGLYGGTIFVGGVRHLGALAGLQIQRFHFFGGFLTHLRQLRGYSALSDFIKHQSRGVV